MKVRGNVVTSIDSFVKSRFPDRYDEWKDQLPKDSSFITEQITGKQWYPVEESVLAPTKKLAELLYSGDVKSGAWESGRWSAEVALNGIYKVFVVISTPTYLMKRASRILPTFYEPSELEVVKSGGKFMSIDVTKLPTQSEIIEYRIGGWMQKALEICGCKDVNIMIPDSMSKGDEITRYDITWN